MKHVVFQPQVGRSLCDGADALVSVIAPTLGPLARTVLLESGFGRDKSPSLIHDGGTLARRIVELPDRDADVGAMMLRHALWRVQERAGDGVATTAVLFQAITRSAVAYLAAGGMPMQVRRGIQLAAEAACQALARQARPLPGDRAALAGWLAAQSDDHDLVDTLADVFRQAGPASHIHVENAHGQRSEFEFMRGALWASGWHAAPYPAEEIQHHPTLRLNDAHVLVTDLDLSDQSHLRPLILCLSRLTPPRLLVICRQVSDGLTTLFTQAHQRGIGDAVFVKVPPATGAERMALLNDIATLTGARLIPYIEPRGSERPCVDLEDWLPDSLGRARVAWANRDYFGLEGGRGDKHGLRDHIRALERQLDQENEPTAIAGLQNRVARLNGGVTLLRIGAPTETAQKQRRDQAERLIRLAGQALRHGVVPGAGAALLACQPAIQALKMGERDEGARQGMECVSKALEAPLRTLARNAGLVPSTVVSDTRAAPEGFGYDLRVKRLVELRQASILDSAVALQTAVRAAASASATLISVDVIVHHRAPDYQIKP